MMKPTIGTAVTVGLEAGIVEDITVNNGNTLYIVQTDIKRVAVTAAGLEKSNEMMSRKELNKQERAVDTRKPLPDELILALNLDGDPIWYEANCNGDQDADAWFLDHNVEDQDIPRLARALTLCGTCPVREQCLKVGLTDLEINTGIWGGLLPGERIIARYGASRRSVTQKTKMKIAFAVRQRVKEWVHKQMREELKLWVGK
jgi:hypothetical protein